MKRPTSVTVISVLLAVNALVGALAIPVMFAASNRATPDNPMEPPLPFTTMDFVIAFAGIAILAATAVGLFLRQGWMRFLPIAWVAFSLLHGLLSMHIEIYDVMRGLVFVGVASAFLFSEKTNAWFAATGDEQVPAES